jgi:hypothetical protein
MFALHPATVLAQAAIAGIVKDPSGAVLPGVTVEAASPALIEKTRAVVTDGSGQYRIVDLRPGTYTVTFTLTGFNTVRREGIELTGSFNATVNADLRVGSLAETITVTAESPVVDVKSTQSQARISDEVIAAIPSGRQYFSLTQLVPGITTQGLDVGGSSGPSFSEFRSRGGSSDEGLLAVNGFTTGYQGFAVSYYVADLGAAEEVTFDLSGGMGAARTAGPVMNVVPRSGGNTFKGSLFANGASNWMVGNNFTQELQNAGLHAPNTLNKIWDVNGNEGGPLKKDRLWFFFSVRDQGNRKTVAGMWANLNAGDPTKWTYAPDLSRQATDTGRWTNGAGHLTYQATSRDRFSLYWDEQKVCRECLGGEGSATSSPEALPTNEGFPQRHADATWTAPFTRQWLAEAGASFNNVQWGGSPKEPQDTRNLIPVTEQGGIIPGMTYRSTNWTRPFGYTWTWRGSLQYVSGTNNAKFGYEGNRDWNRTQNFTNYNLLAYRFNNGTPNQLTMTLGWPVAATTAETHYSLYGQDQWTRGRLTLQGGIRFEHITSGFPAQSIAPSQFLPQALNFAAQDSPVKLNDLAPRMGVAFDVFGNGKTALRASVGRYAAEPAGASYYGNGFNPISLVQTSTSRSWGDANGNFVPDCNLMNPATNGECGPWSNQNFGKQVFNTQYDPAIMTGWNKRLQTWDVNVSVQQQLVPRVGLEFSYLRRVFGNFRVTDNLALGPQDFDAFTVTVPTDSRLPTSGQQLTYLDVNPAKFGQQNYFVTASDNYGKQTRHYNGVSLSLNARFPSGITARGGFSAGRTVEDDCALLAKLPELLTLGNGATGDGAVSGGQVAQQFCHVETGLNPIYNGLATYTIPKINLEVSGTLSSKSLSDARQTNFNAVLAESVQANLVMINAQARALLGRNLAGNAATTTLNLVQPGTLYGDRQTDFDLRLARLQKLGTTRLRLAVDLYNVLNASTPVSYIQTYGTSWLVPTGILQARFAKVSAQFDF